MELTCPRCHGKTPVPARLCQHCGLPLTSRASTSGSGSAQGAGWGVAAPQSQQPAPVLSGSSPGAVRAQSLQFGRKTVITAGAGLVGSIVASLLLWVTLPWRTLDQASNLRVVLTLAIVAGFCVPAVIAASTPVLQRRLDRALKTGGRAGLIGVVVMVIVGALITRFATPRDVFVGFGGNPAAGAVAWMLFGSGLGLVDGVAGGSRQRSVLGAVGGAVGGLLGYLLTAVVRNEGTFAGVGLLVGLGSGLIQDALKQAWLRVVSGANEGTELILDKARVRLGSSDGPNVDLGLYQDPAIAHHHMDIVRQGGEFRLTPLPNTAATLVNGSPLASSHLLRDGDRIQVGRTVLVFRSRAQPATS